MRFFSGLIVLLLLASASCAFARSERPQDSPAGKAEVGGTAPDFTLKDLQGNRVTLSAQRGKVVFLNFWASWCPPCRSEMPAMERLNEVYGDRNFVILAVNVEQEPDEVRAFLREHPHSFPVLLDAGAEAQRLYGVYRFPETFLIDSQGRIVERYLGPRDWSAIPFLQKIQSMLKE